MKQHSGPYRRLYVRNRTILFARTSEHEQRDYSACKGADDQCRIARPEKGNQEAGERTDTGADDDEHDALGHGQLETRL